MTDSTKKVFHGRPETWASRNAPQSNSARFRVVAHRSTTDKGESGPRLMISDCGLMICLPIINPQSEIINLSDPARQPIDVVK
jgi:hypothetical protein